MKITSLNFSLCLIFTVFVRSSISYRILCLFPTPAPSHHIVFRAFTDGLLEKGHTLVVGTPYPVKDPHPNLTQIDWHNVVKLWTDINFADSKNASSLEMMKKYISVSPKIIDLELSHPDAKKLMTNAENEHFDAVVVENHFYGIYAMAKMFKAPLIVISSSDPNQFEHAAVGNVVHLIAAPLRVSKTYGHMTFLERFQAVTRHLMFKPFYYFFEFSFREIMVKHFGPDVPSLADLSQEIDWLLINVNPAFGYIRPITPKTITLGFMHIKDPKPLSKELQTYLDKSTNGVVYCSFGTQVQPNKLNDELIKKLLHGFSKLKYNVIFKFSNKTIDELPKNVKIMEWIPQADLLAHKNIKLFITQGGQHSIEEAIYREVPLLVMPFFGDQFVNGKRVEARKLGKWMNIDEQDSETLINTIDEIISNPIYKENIIKLSKVVKDEPMRPVEKAVWWTEYAIRNKDSKDVLKYHGVDIPTYQYFYLDVIAAFIGILVIIFYILKALLKTVLILYRKLKAFVSKKKID